MRISSLIIYEQIRKGLQDVLQELSRRNDELATGKKILKPSDDVISTSRSIDYKIEISLREQYLRNINRGDLQFEFTDKVLGSVADTLLELRKLTSSGINPQDSMAREFNSQRAGLLRDSLYALVNSRFLDRFIFSGFRTDREAFIYNPSTFAYDYQGDLGEMGIPVNNSTTVSVNIPGSKIFSLVLKGSIPSNLSDGTPVRYIQSYDPSTGINTITIEIGDPLHPAHDIFAVRNIMEIANLLSHAWRYEDLDGTSIGETRAMHRIEALAPIIDDARTQVLQRQTELATRRAFLKDETERTKTILNTLKNNLSKTEDADLTEVAVEIKKAETSLEALRIASIKVLSSSLLDFLK